MSSSARSIVAGSPARGRGLAARLGLAIAGSLVLWASAKVQIPFYPVPMTLQTLAVLMIGALLGPRLGAATVGLYLLEGAVGLPVFAGTPDRGIGLAYMIGPTGGYLLGYLLAAFGVGWLVERGWSASLPRLAAALFAGLCLIYGPGLAWLAIVLGPAKPILAFGLVPFLPAEAVKLALGVAACRALRAR